MCVCGFFCCLIQHSLTSTRSGLRPAAALLPTPSWLQTRLLVFLCVYLSISALYMIHFHHTEHLLKILSHHHSSASVSLTITPIDRQSKLTLCQLKHSLCMKRWRIILKLLKKWYSQAQWTAVQGGRGGEMVTFCRLMCNFGGAKLDSGLAGG